MSINSEESFGDVCIKRANLSFQEAETKCIKIAKDFHKAFVVQSLGLIESKTTEEEYHFKIMIIKEA